MGNLPFVQDGLKASKNGQVQLGDYQEIRIRHFHRTLDKYLDRFAVRERRIHHRGHRGALFDGAGDEVRRGRLARGARIKINTPSIPGCHLRVLCGEPFFLPSLPSKRTAMPVSRP